MDQTLTCPVCGYDNEWDGSRARTIQCKRCETELRTPGRQTEVRVADRPEAAPPESKPRSAVWKIVIFSLVGLKVAAIAGKIVFDLNKGPQKQVQVAPAQFQPPAKGVPLDRGDKAPRPVAGPQAAYTLVNFATEGLDQAGDLKLRIEIRRNFPAPINERLSLAIKVGEDYFRVPLRMNIALQPATILPFSLPAAFVPAGPQQACAWIETIPNDPRLPARKLSGEVNVAVP